jgi:hypothetical protein
MTRNTFGGTKHKKTARKDNNRDNGGNLYLRKSTHPAEMYGRVFKMFGNGMMEAMGQDGIKYLVIIRQKFSGKKKHKNLLSPGSYILMGKREFETQLEKGKTKCDLLELYDRKEVQKLKQEGLGFDWNIFNNSCLDYEENECDQIEFEDDAAARGNELAHEMELEVGASIQFGGGGGSDVGSGGDKVDIDDI